MEVLFTKRYPITSKWGPRGFYMNGKYVEDFHYGVDFGTPMYVEIRAPFDGLLTSSADPNGGLWLDLTHGDNRLRFVHLDKVLVQGKTKKGQIIALTGNTGWSTGPHTHVEHWYKNKRINPLPYLQELDKEYMLEQDYLPVYEQLKKDRKDIAAIEGIGWFKWWVMFGLPELMRKLDELGRFDVLEKVQQAKLDVSLWYAHNAKKEYKNIWEAMPVINY